MSKHRLCSLIAALALLAHAGAALAGAKAPFTGMLNINTATAQELMQLPGIGPAKAQAIVEYRTQTPFKSPADLALVKGIGDKLYAKLEPHITVSGSNSVAAKVVAGQPGAAGKTAP